MQFKALPSATYINESISYNEYTGEVIWKKRPLCHFKNMTSMKKFNTRHEGKAIAGKPKPDGYIYISLGGERYLLHRIIWKAVTNKDPDGEIDHINGDRADNRAKNLRCISHQDNGKNQGRRKDNTSGINGVSWCKQTKRWLVVISIDGKARHVGRFSDISEAAKARAAAEKRYGFHNNHGRRKSFRRES